METKTFIIELTEDTEINGAFYSKGTDFSFDNKIPEHIKELINLGKAKDVTNPDIISPEELPKVTEEPVSSQLSDAGQPAVSSTFEVPEIVPENTVIDNLQA